MRIGWMQKSGSRSISDSDAGLVIDTNHLSRYYGKGRAMSISCRHILQVCTTSHIRKCAKSLPVWRGGTMVLAEQPHWPQPFLWPPVISVICCSTSGQYSTVQYSTVQYSTVQYSTVQYSTIQYSTVQYSTVQYSTMQYSTIQ